MLVKMDRAMIYTGERVEGPNGARPNKRYAPKDIVEVPSEYYERHMEPYGIAHPHNAAAAAAKDLVESLKGQNKQQLADLAEKHGVKAKGTGSGGGVTRRDLILALSKAGVEPDGAGDD